MGLGSTALLLCERASLALVSKCEFDSHSGTNHRVTHVERVKAVKYSSRTKE